MFFRFEVGPVLPQPGPRRLSSAVRADTAGDVELPSTDADAPASKLADEHVGSAELRLPCRCCADRTDVRQADPADRGGKGRRYRSGFRVPGTGRSGWPSRSAQRCRGAPAALGPGPRGGRRAGEAAQYEACRRSTIPGPPVAIAGVTAAFRTVPDRSRPGRHPGAVCARFGTSRETGARGHGPEPGAGRSPCSPPSGWCQPSRAPCLPPGTARPATSAARSRARTRASSV